MINPFFKNKGPFNIAKLLKLASINYTNNFKKVKVNDIKDLTNANHNEISFFHSKKYESFASKTKASFCITTNSLAHLLPEDCNKIVVDNVLISTAKITKVFYPNSVVDNFDNTVKDIKKTTLTKKN